MKNNKGFTLIEVLVAVLVFAVGMLGLAGLQLRAHQATSYAHNKTATTLASSHIIERMRANNAGVTANAYVFDSATGLPNAINGCSSAAGCTANNMAQNDIREWLLALNEDIPLLLPAGLNGARAFRPDTRVVICQDSTPPPPGPLAAIGANINCDGALNQWTIYIDWVEQRDDRTNNLQNYRQTFTFNPNE